MRLQALLFGFLGVMTLAAVAPPAHAQQQDQVITCGSDDGGRHTCAADVRGGVSLGRQRSGSPCVEGQTWGYDRRGVWVDKGCRADFVLEAREGNGNGYLGDQRDRDRDRDDDRARGNGSGQTITCSSDDGDRHYCAADTSGGVQLANQRSGSPCVQGRSWGYDRRGIWVDKGCRADFTLTSGGGYGRNEGYGASGAGRTITCSSDDGDRHYCSADTSRGVQLVNQRSGSACVQGRSWGYDRRGIWVDKGCRADFAIR